MQLSWSAAFPLCDSNWSSYACRAGIRVVRVPTYSPTSVAEMALALAMCLNRCGLRHCSAVQAPRMCGGQGALKDSTTLSRVH